MFEWDLPTISCLLLLIATSSGQQFAGEPCLIQSTNTVGECRSAHQCLQAFQGGGDRRPQLCSFSGTEAIVCCPNNGLHSQEQKPPQRVYLGQRTPEIPTRSEDRRGVPAQRRSQLKCAEYSKLATKKFSASPLTLDPETYDFEVPDCDFTTPLIVDGEKTKAGEFPHMAALGWRGDTGAVEFKCGGVLISDQYVLTAAHCTSPSNSPSFVRLGDQNLIRGDDNAEPQDYAIAQITMHPEFRRPLTYHDISLIRLSSRVKFTKFIRPACLWQNQNLNITQAVATGWGLTDFDADNSDDLLKVSLNVFPNHECQSYFERTRKTPEGIIDSQLCAGNRGGRQDTCQGDSGGPLQAVIPGKNCIFHVMGLTSFGKFCGLSHSPGVYTRVSAYLDWIEPIVWP